MPQNPIRSEFIVLVVPVLLAVRSWLMRSGKLTVREVTRRNQTFLPLIKTTAFQITLNLKHNLSKLFPPVFNREYNLGALRCTLRRKVLEEYKHEPTSVNYIWLCSPSTSILLVCMQSLTSPDDAQVRFLSFAQPT